MLTVPLTVTCEEALKVKSPLLPFPAEPSVIVLQVPVETLTVRTAVLLTTMSSVEFGWPAGPLPVVMALQFVLVVIVTVAPKALVARREFVITNAAASRPNLTTPSFISPAPHAGAPAMRGHILLFEKSLTRFINPPTTPANLFSSSSPAFDSQSASLDH